MSIKMNVPLFWVGLKECPSLPLSGLGYPCIRPSPQTRTKNSIISVRELFQPTYKGILSAHLDCFLSLAHVSQIISI